MDEEAPLDVELQKVVNMVHSNDMECTTEFAHLSDSVARPSDTIECPIVNGKVVVLIYFISISMLYYSYIKQNKLMQID